ncbi:MAG TPA: hypothetical protein VGK20_18690 [Candidatus Binatia bacterium]
MADRGFFGALQRVMPVLGLIVVALFAFRRLDDFDTWWHLASGRWIALHHAIPHTDVLSFTEPNNEWVNLQWLYDLFLYVAWNIGGASGLVLLSLAAFVVTFAIVARNLIRHVGPVATGLLVCWLGMTVNERFLIRPEMVSFPLLAAIQLLLVEGRDEPRRLRLLVPLMVLWANLHSLFILGVGAILCAIGGAVAAMLPVMPATWRRDSGWSDQSRRELFIWGSAAIAGTLLNPYFLRALTFPIQLMSRINGTSPVYGVIGEFRPPFSGYFPTFAIGSYQVFVFTAAGLAVVAGLLRALSSKTEEREGFDVGVLTFALVLGYLSLLARRNVGVFAIGAVPFVAACLGIVLRRLPSPWTRPNGLAVRVSSVLVAIGMSVVCWAVVTNRWYAISGETHEFGLGILDVNFQARAVQFFRDQMLPGPLYNDMTAGGYLTWDDPTGKGVYVDGRLEVYDTPFFSAYLTGMSNFASWKKDVDARGIQSVMVFHRWSNRHPFIHMLMSSPEWRLVYFDETVVLFVRTGGANDALIASARGAFQDIWKKRTEQILQGGDRTWPWQWHIERYTGQLSYARILEVLGAGSDSQPWYEAGLATGLPGEFQIEPLQRSAAYLAASHNFAQSRQQLEKALALEPSGEEGDGTREMLKRLDAATH